MILQLVSLVLLVYVNVASAEQFQAPVTDTHWQVIESPLECTLSQTIPDYGNAKFTKSTGTDLSLVFTSPSHPTSQNSVLFEIAEAPWQNSEDRFLLTAITAQSGQSEFTLSGALAEKALAQMQEGRFPTIRYKSKNSLEDISALLSTVHLADSLISFQQCITNLYPDTFDDVKKLTVYFALESSNLNAVSKKALKRIADYINVDESVNRIRITGHTDNHGRKRLNGPLSEQRSAAVKNYLIEIGVPETMITTSAVRDLKPKTSNKTQKGRSFNRRAEIELFK